MNFTINDLCIALTIGLFGGLFIALLVTVWMPHLAGWRKVEYHLHWSDNAKLDAFRKNVKWTKNTIHWFGGTWGGNEKDWK